MEKEKYSMKNKCASSNTLYINNIKSDSKNNMFALKKLELNNKNIAKNQYFHYKHFHKKSANDILSERMHLHSLRRNAER
jgi:hypothetical protein